MGKVGEALIAPEKTGKLAGVEAVEPRLPRFEHHAAYVRAVDPSMCLHASAVMQRSAVPGPERSMLHNMPMSGLGGLSRDAGSDL